MTRLRWSQSTSALFLQLTSEMRASNSASSVRLRPMTADDLPAVEALDRASFPTPWPKDAFRYELERNPHALCWVAERYLVDSAEAYLIGVIVVWLVVDEAHIATLAVSADERRHGIAQQLLAQTLLICYRNGAQRALLEVREHNLAAQELYHKFGFEVVGSRSDYYQDTHEKALLMTLHPLSKQGLRQLAASASVRKQGNDIGGFR